MAKMWRLASAAAAAVLQIGFASAMISANTCHGSTIKSTSSTCEDIIIPTGLCSSCEFGNIDGKGNYYDCSRTMKVENTMCIDSMQRYVNMNPCDDGRKTALDEFRSNNSTISEIGRKKIDFFLYSVCEQGEFVVCWDQTSKLFLPFYI